MEVNKISATIRYSQDTGKGSWKVVELGAEASISDREFWQQEPVKPRVNLDRARTLVRTVRWYCPPCRFPSCPSTLSIRPSVALSRWSVSRLVSCWA